MMLINILKTCKEFIAKNISQKLETSLSIQSERLPNSITETCNIYMYIHTHTHIYIYIYIDLAIIHIYTVGHFNWSTQISL